MAIEYNFTLDMDRSKRDNNIAYARTGDMDSITINADLVFGGTAYTPSGTNAFFECITPNGRSVRASAEKTGSSVSVEVPSAAFQAAGVINVAYFRFESGASGNPTYVESTEPFAIIVREGIGDNIDAGDYIEEWRKLADQLEAAVAEVEKKAEQAETAINEQKTEVDQLKAQAQKAIAGDVTEVEGAAQSAIAAINQEKADVADAAEDISAAGEQAINSFNSKGTSAINKFNTNGTSAINQFNTNAGSKLDEVDGMITEAQGDVDAAITQLETATGKAVSAMEDALDGTTAGSLRNAINRTLKLDVADMTNIPDNSSLSSFTNVGSYCCKTVATAATVGDCPIDDSPFNMYVFSSATSGQVMQLVVPIDLNGKPTAEWHVRFGTSSAMDPWSVIGGGADIAAGLGIDVTGDAKKTVALDTTAFYQHHEAADIIQGSTEVTGGGRIKKLTVYGNTSQNLWVNPSGTSKGVTVTSNDDGSMTLSGSATADASIQTHKIYIIRPSTTYSIGTDNAPKQGVIFAIYYYDSDGKYVGNRDLISAAKKQDTFTTPAEFAYAVFIVYVPTGVSASGTYRVMLVEGGTAPNCFTPPASITSVQAVNLVTAGKNLLPTFAVKTDPMSKKGLQATVNDDGTYTISGTSTERYSSPLKGLNITLKPGTYTLSGRLASTDNMNAIYAQCSINGSYIVAPDTFTVKEQTVYNFSVMAPTAGSTFDGVLSCQLELGSTVTDYEPPNVTTTPLHEVELRGLPDGTCDELVIKADGTCEVERKLAQKTIDAEHPISVSNVHPASGTDLPYVAENYMFAAFDSANYDFSGTVISTSWPSTTSLKSRGVYRMWNAVIFVDERFTDAETAQNIINEAGGTFVAQVPLSAEHQSTVTLPVLPAPGYTVYATSSVPVEIEAEVVKVDYLPAPDVYTKEEVDRKIEDAGMPAIVPVSKGGTGVTTAAAERNRLGLGNTTGALPVANGGTGKTTVKAAQNALLANIDTVSTDVGDESFFVGYYQSPSDATGALYKRVSSDIWNWIVSKIRSTFGFNSSNVLPVANGGTGSTSAKAAQNSLLNDMNMSSDALTDSSMLVGYNASPSASDGAVHKRSVSTVWDYVVGKIRGTFGFTSSNVLPVSNGGTGLTKAPSMLVNLESASADNPLASDPRPGVSGELPLARGGTGGTSAVAARTNLGVYSKAEVDGKVPKVVYGTGNIPSNAENGTIYIQYRS